MDEFVVRTAEQLSPLLRAFRKEAQLTQGEVAEHLGVTQQTVSALERNAESVSTQRLLHLLNTLGVEIVLRPKRSVTQAAAQPADSGPAW